MYTDLQSWPELLSEVFVENVWLDMSSAGAGDPVMMQAADVCEMWKEGLAGLDAIHHQSGHYLITVQNNKADIYAYGTATHYKKAATRGNTRTFTGSYDLKAERTGNGWRLTQFKFNLKYMEGNISLE